MHKINKNASQSIVKNSSETLDEGILIEIKI